MSFDITEIVPSLKERCIFEAAKLVLNTCYLIEKKWGKYPKKLCYQQFVIYEKSLVNQLDTVFSEVYEKTLKLRWLCSLKMIYALGMQSTVRNFNFTAKWADYSIQYDTSFWERNLGKLKGIVVLDIHNVSCTNVALKLIGVNCRHLEVIRFNSQRLQKSGKIVPEINPTGLRYLTHLKNLRVVDDVSNFKTIRSSFLKHFFHRLLHRLENFYHPMIKELVFDNLGKLKSLPLKQVVVHDVKPGVLLKLFNICPALTDLQFRGSLLDHVFDDLANNANANVTSLGILNMHVDHITGLFHYLSTKGDILTALTLETDAVINIITLQLINECCPNLEQLKLSIAASKSENLPFQPFVMETPLFPKLKSLALMGQMTGFEGELDLRICQVFSIIGSSIETLMLQGSWVLLFEEVVRDKKFVFPNLTVFKLVDKFNKNYGLSLMIDIVNFCKKLTVVHIPYKFYWNYLYNTPDLRKVNFVLHHPVKTGLGYDC